MLASKRVVLFQIIQPLENVSDGIFKVNGFSHNI